MNGKNGGQEMLNRVIVPVIVLALGGVWAFASSRAGHDDLDRVRAAGEERETRILDEIEKLEDAIKSTDEKVHRAEVEQAEVRAQVRAALRISEEGQ